MRTPEQKHFPFEPSPREEPEESGPPEIKRSTASEDADERARLKETYGEGAEDAALTSHEVKKKKGARDKTVDELRAKIRRKLEGGP